ncbi:transposase [Dietzia sp. 2505]|uniref:transposase n=1 Tax=Dietzia sp. 2505 TaxID=3156457 RepID=UPI0033946D23
MSAKIRGQVHPLLSRKGQLRLLRLDAMATRFSRVGWPAGARTRPATTIGVEHRSRPLKESYPVAHLHAVHIKVRQGHRTLDRSAHIAVGVDRGGHQERPKK